MVGYSSKIFELDVKARHSHSSRYFDAHVVPNLDSNLKELSHGPLRNLKSITKDISNFKDLQYYGELYIGSNRQ